MAKPAKFGILKPEPHLVLVLSHPSLYSTRRSINRNEKMKRKILSICTGILTNLLAEGALLGGSISSLVEGRCGLRVREEEG
jgi:hypothetical protein